MARQTEQQLLQELKFTNELLLALTRVLAGHAYAFIGLASKEYQSAQQTKDRLSRGSVLVTAELSWLHEVANKGYAAEHETHGPGAAGEGV